MQTEQMLQFKSAQSELAKVIYGVPGDYNNFATTCPELLDHTRLYVGSLSQGKADSFDFKAYSFLSEFFTKKENNIYEY